MNKFFLYLKGFLKFKRILHLFKFKGTHFIFSDNIIYISFIHYGTQYFLETPHVPPLHAINKNPNLIQIYMKDWNPLKNFSLVHKDKLKNFKKENKHLIAKPHDLNIYQKMWFKDGSLHHDIFSAVEIIGGTSRWYQNGLLHREDGPSVIYQDGKKEWWRRGVKIKIQEHEKHLFNIKIPKSNKEKQIKI